MLSFIYFIWVCVVVWRMVSSKGCFSPFTFRQVPGVTQIIRFT